MNTAKNIIHKSVLLAGALGFVLAATGCGGGGSSASSTNTGFNATVASIVPANDASGDVSVGGLITSYNGQAVNRLVRLNSNGSIDTGFVPGLTFDGPVLSMVLANDGSGDIYVDAVFMPSSANVLLSKLVRLNSDGSVDTGFDPGTGFDRRAYTIEQANDGSGDIYAGGEFTSYRGNNRNRIVRINSDGSNDAGFDPGTGLDGTVRSIVPANDGSGDIYAGGEFTSYRGNNRNRIVRINSDGSNDAGFNVGTGFDNIVESVAMANDGSGDVYAGGLFTLYRGNPRNYIARINSDGSNDAGFNVGTGFDDIVYSIVPANDGSGDVYVGGRFTTYNGNPANRLVRLNSDGSIDTGFKVGSGFDDIVVCIEPANDGSGDIYVGGNFTRYKSMPVGRFIRLDSAGNPS